MKKDILYLASQSTARRRLLKEAKIEFELIEHKSDECVVHLEDRFEDYVLDIAKDKMKHVDLAKIEQEEEKEIFVLTADTLVFTKKSKHVLGKPEDLEDAKRIISLVSSEKVKIITGCCLEKKVFKNNSWLESEKSHWVTSSEAEFCVEKEDLNLYFKNCPGALHSAGSAIIEDFGQRFCKTINGSYSSVLGLPVFELVQALKKMKFKF